MGQVSKVCAVRVGQKLDLLTNRASQQCQAVPAVSGSLLVTCSQRNRLQGSRPADVVEVCGGLQIPQAMQGMEMG